VNKSFYTFCFGLNIYFHDIQFQKNMANVWIHRYSCVWVFMCVGVYMCK